MNWSEEQEEVAAPAQTKDQTSDKRRKERKKILPKWYKLDCESFISNWYLLRLVFCLRSRSRCMSAVACSIVLSFPNDWWINWWDASDMIPMCFPPCPPPSSILVRRRSPFAVRVGGWMSSMERYDYAWMEWVRAECWLRWGKRVTMRYAMVQWGPLLLLSLSLTCRNN